MNQKTFQIYKVELPIFSAGSTFARKCYYLTGEEVVRWCASASQGFRRLLIRLPTVAKHIQLLLCPLCTLLVVSCFIKGKY
jgi:hypothetical protein